MANTSNESGSCYTKPSRLPARRSNGPKPSGHRSGFIAVRYGTPAATRTERSDIISWRKQSASPASVAVRAAKHIPASRYCRERGRRSALPYRLRSCSAYHALPHPQSKPKDMRPYPEVAATAAAAHASPTAARPDDAPSAAYGSNENGVSLVKETPHAKRPDGRIRNRCPRGC